MKENNNQNEEKLSAENDNQALNNETNSQPTKEATNCPLPPKPKFPVTIFDIGVIIVALCLAGFFFFKPSSYAGDDKKLTLFAGETQIIIPFIDQKINFKNDFYDIEFNKHNINRDIILEIKDKKARVITSDCPDKVCVNSSWATNCGHMIICMPNAFGVLIDCKGNANENK